VADLAARTSHADMVRSQLSEDMVSFEFIKGWQLTDFAEKRALPCWPLKCYHYAWARHSG